MIAWFFWLIIIIVIIIWTERPKKNILCLVNQNVFIWPGQEHFVGLLYEKAPTKRHDCKDKGFTSSGSTWLNMKNKTYHVMCLRMKSNTNDGMKKRMLMMHSKPQTC